ncbi:hypothetical protein [Corynebacterium stationis]|jgi:hypothetical protein|uniref:hypothetical protein n=1 Tax=Corynebacterium stationis TaxID=1705 RepID=UPI002635F0FF|nr:hypothetical protein [Corynebacterium stationis]
MEIVSKSEVSSIEQAGIFLSESVTPWLVNQLSSVCDQLLVLTISALVGGLISRGITRRSDDRAQKDVAARQASFLRRQELRDKQRNLFEYRNWKATKELNSNMQWHVDIRTSSHDRKEWVLLAIPKFDQAVHKVRFFVHSIQPEKEMTELTSIFLSKGDYVTHSGVDWVSQKGHKDHWTTEPGGVAIFSFSIGDIIDDTDTLTIHYAVEGGPNTFESHSISPFDSMKVYRPWDAVVSENNE